MRLFTFLQFRSSKGLLFKGFQDFTENAGGGQLWLSMMVLSVNQAPHPLFEIMSKENPYVV